jgi:hypothetical protein
MVLSLQLLNAQQSPPQPVRVIVRVETEGPQGLWMQAGTDLSAAELDNLRKLITAEIAALPGHQLVSSTDKHDDLGIVVVAEKLHRGQDTHFLLSSVLTIAKADGTDLFVSHDVIAAPTIALAAKSVAGYLTSVELRGILGGPFWSAGTKKN